MDEHLKYTAARRAYVMHNTGKKPEKFDSWVLWWEDRYKEDFWEYVALKKREKDER